MDNANKGKNAFDGYMTKQDFKDVGNMDDSIYEDDRSGGSSMIFKSPPLSLKTLDFVAKERANRYYEKAERAKFISSGTIDLIGKSAKARKQIL